MKITPSHMKNIIYLHGMGSSGATQTADYLRLKLPEVEVVSPDIPLHPEEALKMLHQLCDVVRPDIIVGTSMGAMYAQQLHNYKKILVNPAFHVSEIMRTNLGTNKWLSPRSDGQTEFVIDSELCDLYQKMEASQFCGITEFDKKHTYAFFGTADTLVNGYEEYLQYYFNATKYPGEHRLLQKWVKLYIVPCIKELLVDKMYTKGDYVEFLTNQPDIHLNEMFGYNNLGSDDFEKKLYIGLVKSVIDNETYLATTIRPIEGFNCIVSKVDIIRIVDRDELTAKELSYTIPEHYAAPNTYISNNEVEGSTIEEKCMNLAKEAMTHLYPDDEVESFEFIASDFLKKDIIEKLHHSILFFCEDAENITELYNEKDEIASFIESSKFKEYYELRVNVYDPYEDNHSSVNCNYMAVDLQFKEAVLMRSMDDLPKFALSLGPGYDAAMSWRNHFRKKLISLSRSKG